MCLTGPVFWIYSKVKTDALLVIPPKVKKHLRKHEYDHLAIKTIRIKGHYFISL